MIWYHQISLFQQHHIFIHNYLSWRFDVLCAWTNICPLSFIVFASAPLFSVPLFGGSATIEWITLSSSGVSVADSRAKTQRILQGNDSTIPRWVKTSLTSIHMLIYSSYIGENVALKIGSTSLFLRCIMLSFNSNTISCNVVYIGDSVINLEFNQRLIKSHSVGVSWIFLFSCAGLSTRLQSSLICSRNYFLLAATNDFNLI